MRAMITTDVDTHVGWRRAGNIERPWLDADATVLTWRWKGDRRAAVAYRGLSHCSIDRPRRGWLKLLTTAVPLCKTKLNLFWRCGAS
jgi:hypothetical protein